MRVVVVVVVVRWRWLVFCWAGASAFCNSDKCCLVSVPAVGFGFCPTTERGPTLYNYVEVQPCSPRGSKHVGVTSVKLGRPIVGRTPIAANTVFRKVLVSKA